MQLPPSVVDIKEGEAKEHREERMKVIAKAIDEASKTKPKGISRLMMASILITIGNEETHYADYVGRGDCEEGPVGWRCDYNHKTKKSKARTYWQLWERACPKAWASEKGSEQEIMIAAQCAARHWRYGMNHCARRYISRNPPDGFIALGFSGYRSGMDCEWSVAKTRAYKAVQMRKKLERIMWTEKHKAKK